jgi:nitrate reductase beta subunit
MPEQDAHLSDRAKKAAKIIAKPHDFKICEGCDSIVASRVATCPNCNGYRFDEDAAAVISQAKMLASREQRGVTSEDLL